LGITYDNYEEEGITPETQIDSLTFSFMVFTYDEDGLPTNKIVDEVVSLNTSDLPEIESGE